MSQVCQELKLNYDFVAKKQVATASSKVKGLISSINSSNDPTKIQEDESALQREVQFLQNVSGNLRDAATVAAENNCEFGGRPLSADFNSLADQADGLINEANQGLATADQKIKDIDAQQVKTENKPEDPASENKVGDPKQNQANDDASKPATPGENQSSGVVATPSQTTSAANANTATGAAASPGPAGTGPNGAGENPGKRLYNPLSQLASYTYSFTLYMITPDAYDAFILSGRRKIDALSTGGGGAFVIAQSGGINNKTQQRAPGFELDYYIDNVRFTTPMSPKTTGAPAFYQFLSFTITEPFGFSFLANLKKAREAIQQYSNQTTYKECTNNFAQFFILGIRFYGYDINGNLVKGSDVLYDTPIDPVGGTEALFENFYDLSLQDIKFTVNGKTTQYQIQASSPGGQAGLGTKRGRIETGCKLRGSTVHEMLMGPEGLLTKLNKAQQDKVKKNPQDQMFANEYDVVYMDDAYEKIGKASMVLASDLNKWRWPGSNANNTTEATDAIGIKAIPDNTQRELVFNNDTGIIQAITGIVGKSRFMEDALKTVYNNVTQPNPEQKSVEETKKNPGLLSWINVSTEITNPRWDPIISDWAYKMTYVIQRYETPAVNTGYSNQGEQYYGPHKRYMYYLTGQNSEVLDFVLNFNLAYQNVVLAAPGGEGANKGSTASGTFPVQSGARQNADSTGSLSTAQEAQNSVVTDLTSPEAYIDCKVKILGDPDFLVRDQTSSIAEVYNRFYGTDGFTVGANGGQVYIEVGLNEGKDYKNSTGLFQVNEEVLFQKYKPSVKAIAKGIIFMVREVQSSFSNGRFEQTIVTNLATAFNDKDEGKSSSTSTSDAASRETPEQLEEVTVTGKRNAGAAVGNSKATVSNTGQKSDPPPPTQPQLSSSSQPTTNTTGNAAPQTTNTPIGPVADDDAAPPKGASPPATTTQTEAREEQDLRNFSDGELFSMGYNADEIQQIRSGALQGTGSYTRTTTTTTGRGGG